MPLFELIAAVICGVLDALGGYHWLFARRYILPFLMGVSASIIACVTQGNLSEWWIGFCCLPAMGTFTIGYPSGQNWGRGLWLFIQAIALSLALAITGHLGFNHWGVNIDNSWVIFVPYIVLAGVLGGIYKNWQQKLGDLVTGSYLGTLLFFIK